MKGHHVDIISGLAVGRRLGASWGGLALVGPLHRHPTCVGLVVSTLTPPAPYFEGAKSIFGLSFAQVQGFRVVPG